MEKLNNLHTDISFTVELGGTKLPFLDTQIELKSTNITSTVFRKPTCTDVILNYSAVAPMKWKTGLIKCLVHRAYKVCSDKNLLRNEIDHLRHLFFKNGYPTKLFDRVTDEYFKEEEKKPPIFW